MRDATESEILNFIEGEQKMNSIFTFEIEFTPFRDERKYVKVYVKARELDNDEILYVLKGNKHRLIDLLAIILLVFDCFCARACSNRCSWGLHESKGRTVLKK